MQSRRDRRRVIIVIKDYEKNNKGIMSIEVVIGIIILLIVLAVVIAIFITKTKSGAEDLGSCEAKGGDCSTDIGSKCPEGSIVTISFKCKDTKKQCCIGLG